MASFELSARSRRHSVPPARRNLKRGTLAAALILAGIGSAAAEPLFARQYKQTFGYTPSCNACHKDGGGTPLNVYGEQFKEAGMDLAAFATIAPLDADGDGFEEDYLLATSAIAGSDPTGYIVTGDDGASPLNLLGSASDDLIIGNSAGGDIDAGGGDDRVVVSELDSQTVQILDGGTGTDTVSFEAISSGNGVILDLDGVGAGLGNVGDGINPNDTLNGFENVIGTDFADTIRADGNDHILHGGAGAAEGRRRAC